MMRTATIAALLLFSTQALAADPPSLIHYQGVLRDSLGVPLEGDVDMTFRFWDAETDGDELLVDRHLASDQQAVVVAGGMFAVPLGGGVVADGTGPGNYTSLAEIFRDHEELWLEVEVNFETLSPRSRVGASGYAFNSAFLSGLAATDFVNTTMDQQAKPGKLIVGATSGTEESYAVEGFGGYAGGYFESLAGNGNARVGVFNYGIQAYGNTAGGYFKDLTSSGEAWVAHAGWGIKAKGSYLGGDFRNTVGAGYAKIAYTGVGIIAGGDYSGGRFEDVDSSGIVELGFGDFGLDAHGEYQSFGNGGGGRFQDTLFSGLAFVAHGNEGIYAQGTNAGGEFRDSDSGSWAQVGRSTYKIYGSGAVSFVQNHPDDQSKVVVYHAPEASEVSVYTRGKGVLTGGVASIALDETFRWVTNPDLGLTAHLTPRGMWCPLHVTEITTSSLSVGADDPACSDAVFDYMVWGLRIGFEESAPVQTKQQEAYVPAMDDHHAAYARDTSLRRFNALERFGQMEPQQDLSRANDLLGRIGEFDPAMHGADEARRDTGVAEADTAIESDEASASANPTVHVGSALSSQPTAIDLQTAVSAPRTWLMVAEPIEAGELLALDPLHPGMLRRAASIADPLVVGIAAGPSRANDEGQLEAPMAEGRYATVKVDAGFGAIRPGDLLVASSTAGHAMRAIEPQLGAVIGKAIDALDFGQGSIRVFLAAR